MFGRLLNITIYNDEGIPLTLVTEDDPNALIANVKIECMPSKEMTSAEVTIENLDQDTRRVIKEGKYKYMRVGFGYRDLSGVPETIFEGTLYRMITNRPQAETSETTFYCYELGDVYQYGWFSSSIPMGMSYYDAFKMVTNKGTVKIPVQIADELKHTIRRKTKSYYGSQMDVLNELVGELRGYMLMHTMGQVYIMSEEERESSEIIVMSAFDEGNKLVSASGLINIPTLEDTGLSFECLVNPKMHIYSTVLIANSLIGNAQSGFVRQSEAGAEFDSNGLYIVLKISTNLTNGPSRCSMKCRAISRDYYTEGLV